MRELRLDPLFISKSNSCRVAKTGRSSLADIGTCVVITARQWLDEHESCRYWDQDDEEEARGSSKLVKSTKKGTASIVKSGIKSV